MKPVRPLATKIRFVGASGLITTLQQDNGLGRYVRTKKNWLAVFYQPTQHTLRNSEKFCNGSWDVLMYKKIGSVLNCWYDSEYNEAARFYVRLHTHGLEPRKTQ